MCRRNLSCGPRSLTELTLPSRCLMLRRERFIANAIVQREAAADLPDILRVVTLHVIPILEILSGGLLQGHKPPEQKVCHRHRIRRIAVEDEDARLLKVIRNINLRELPVAAEGDRVPPMLPVKIVAERVVVASEGSRRIVPDVEEVACG